MATLIARTFVAIVKPLPATRCQGRLNDLASMYSLMLLSLEKIDKRVSKNGDMHYFLPRLRLMAELKTCGHSKPTARSRLDRPRDTSTKKSMHSTAKLEQRAGIMWRRIESRAHDGSIGGAKTRNRIEWKPEHMELKPR